MRTATRTSRPSAAAAEAAVGADGDLRPDRLRRLDLELGAIARLGLVDPAPHGVEGGSVLCPREELSAEQAEPLQGMAAQVVLTALQHGDLHLPAESLRRSRNVLAEQLFLEGLRRGRDDDPPAGVERGDQVRQALARARAGLGEQVLPGSERSLDLGRESGLLRAGLVAWEDPLEAPAGLEERLHARQRTEHCGRRNTCSPRQVRIVRNVRTFRA